MPCGGLFRYYLPGGYIFNRVIAIIETGCDTGYFGKSCMPACFSITCQAVSYYRDRARVAARFSITCQMVNSSIRYLAVYMILAMYALC